MMTSPVAQLLQIQRLAVFFGAYGHAECGEDVADFLVLENPVLHGFLDVQYLAPQRHDRLKIPVAALLGRSAGRVSLDEEDFGLIAVARRAVGQLARQARARQYGLALHQLAGLARRVACRGGEDHFRLRSLGRPSGSPPDSASARPIWPDRRLRPPRCCPASSWSVPRTGARPP